MIHEGLEPVREVELGSERAFGLTFTGFFGLLALLAWLGDSGFLFYWLAGSAAFLTVTLTRPGILRPLNRQWFRLGLLLNRLVSPLVLGGLFFLTITPIGWLMRLFRARPLNLAFDPAAETYWIRRDPPGPAPDSLKNQF